jgi:hypothetical protein
MRVTLCNSPNVKDLVETAHSLMKGRAGATGRKVESDKWLRNFAEKFHKTVLADDANKEIAWFYGMRDFYAFVSFIQVSILKQIIAFGGEKEQ